MKFHSLLFSALLFVISPHLTVESIFAKCREQPINCYDCDSRLFPGCADPFHQSHYIPTKNCQGCCTKAVFRSPDYYVVRTCADFGNTRIFDFDITCEERGGREKKCYCNDNLCNSGHHVSADVIFMCIFGLLAAYFSI